MTEGCDRRGVELAGSRRSLDCVCIGVQVCARGPPQSVRRIQTDLLRQREESVWRRRQVKQRRRRRVGEKKNWVRDSDREEEDEGGRQICFSLYELSLCV